MKIPKNALAKSILRYFAIYRLSSTTFEPPLTPKQEPRKTYRWEALLGKKIIGRVRLTGKSTEEGFQWWLHSLEVHPEMRSLGIGSKLVRQVMARAKKEGSNWLYLTVEADSPAANLYKKFSFLETGKKDMTQNLIEMKRKL